MPNREQDIQRVNALLPEEKCHICWFEAGGGEVHRIWDTLFLFEIPQYGGEGRFVQAFGLDEVERLVDLARTWT